MEILGVIQKKCIACGKCVLDCPEKLFQSDAGGKTVLFHDPMGICIRCGHCIAVCPKDAVRFSDEERPLSHPLVGEPWKIIGTDDLMVFIRSRRSIRHFRNREVSEKALGYILDAMRFAPTGSNKQALHFTVIASKAAIDQFSESVMASFRTIRVLLGILRVLWPFGHRKKSSIVSDGLYKNLVERIEDFGNGDDPILFHAPCVIVLSAPPYAHQTAVDAGIALAHGMLAAQAQGLGSCLVGFAHEKLLLSPSLRRALKLPRGHKPQGVMALGFPTVKYRKAPMRNPVSCTRL